MKSKILSLLLAILFCASPIFAQNGESIVSKTNYNALKLRNIGPAFTSGRIADIAIHPDNENIWYVAIGSGGVWKTENSGTTWQSIFDGQGSYSIGAITIDPNNPHTIWVGTGENVGGRHVAYGDGIYRSDDDGKSWTNMGLESSDHISKIIIHPNNSDVIWVAAQGPLWSKGGDRGLYKSVNGGETWNKTLGDDEWVGATDLVIDPRNPNVLYAATWQRHRNVASYMGGGPGSGLHKSIDGGVTWTALKKGIPNSNLGKIGLAISPQNPDNIYAAIELDQTKGGVFMSSNRGASWQKMSNTVSGGTGPHYYQELYASPHKEGKLYLMDVRVQISEDYGRTFNRMNESEKHSDNHALAFREDDPNYLLVGSDGGLFESHDDTKNWRFIDNLPVTQFYKVAVDDAKPFYNVYGGVQDNGSQGGPSRTDNRHGIRNADWFKTNGADGHQSATEPGNPDIIYAESQQGGLVRVDRITGEQIFIQPQARAGEGFERFNWDAPIVVSPYSPTTLYFASQRVWKSENRGDSWTPISGDLTRNQERFELPIMGRVQSWDNAWDLNAMGVYNTIASLAVSPIKQGLIYAGTDDGIIQISENDGADWKKVELSSIQGIPATAFVNNLYADIHDENVVYAALDNHKFGDYSPYLIKSTDKGNTWKSISSNIPDRTLVWRLVQDHVNPNLLFAATETGIYFTVNGGGEWVKLKGGSPTISFRDVTIQRRENDLVAASFGRGFFILDDYSPLREVSSEMLDKDAVLFPSKDALLFTPRDVAGGSQGANYFTAPNPDYGAVFTYYLKEGSSSLKAERKKEERAMGDDDIPFPGWEALDAEKNEERTIVQVVIQDQNGNVVNRVNGSTAPGFHRINWNLRYASKGLIDPGQNRGFFGGGFLATPGTYSATLIKTEDGVVTNLADTINFDVVPLYEPAVKGASNAEIIAFREKMDALFVKMSQFNNDLQSAKNKLQALETALSRADRPTPTLRKRIYDANRELIEFEQEFSGYSSKNDAGERSSKVSAQSRVFTGFRALNTTYGPTEMHKASVSAGAKEMQAIHTKLNTLVDSIFPSLERDIKAAGAPPIRDN